MKILMVHTAYKSSDTDANKPRNEHANADTKAHTKAHQRTKTNQPTTDTLPATHTQPATPPHSRRSRTPSAPRAASS